MDAYPLRRGEPRDKLRMRRGGGDAVGKEATIVGEEGVTATTCVCLF